MLNSQIDGFGRQMERKIERQKGERHGLSTMEGQSDLINLTNDQMDNLIRMVVK